VNKPHLPAADDRSAQMAPAVTTSVALPIGAGIGLLIVVLTYSVSSLGATDRYWAAGAAILVAVLVADGLTGLCSIAPTPGLVPAALLATLAAIFLCVPETDQIPVAMIVPGVVLAAELLQRRQMGIEWYAVAAASVGWAGMFGATGRQSALAGALFAWWPIVLPMLVNLVRPIRSALDASLVIAVGALAALVMARTGGIADSSSVVVVSVLGAVVVSVGLAALIISRSPEPKPESAPRLDA
jgi:hypothetical protein